MMRWLLRLLIGGFALWSVYWAIAAWAHRSAVETWFDDRRAEGWAADYGSLSVTGYPLRLKTDLGDLQLADPETGVVWSVASVVLNAPAYQPTSVTFTFAREQSLATPLQRYVITAEDMGGVLSLAPGPALRLERAEASGGPTRIEGPRAVRALDGWQMTWVAVGPAVYDIQSNLVGVAPNLGDAASGLPATLDKATLVMRVGFDRPWDITALEESRPQPEEIDLSNARLSWGPVQFQMAGAVTVDTDGQPDGAVRLRAENWREGLEVLEASGQVPAAATDLAEEVLDLIAQLGGRGDTLDVELGLQRGRMWLGPIPVGPAPNLSIR